MGVWNGWGYGIAFFRALNFSWTSARHVRAKMLVFPRFGGPDRSFGRMSAGISGRKLPLWADFSFLNNHIRAAELPGPRWFQIGTRWLRTSTCARMQGRAR